MPPRSNDFQQLIYRIYEQLAPSGAHVKESAMLEDADSNSKTETDILIEHVVADVPLRIAVECRDHSRVSDKQWIEQLIGEYARVPVNVVVAVSRRGFSRTAVKKATANRIETRTLTAAMDEDWPSALMKIGIGRFQIDIEQVQLTPRTSPRLVDGDVPAQVLTPGGEQLTFQQFIDAVGRQAGPKIAAQFLDTGMGKPISELNKRGTWEDVFTIPGLVFVDQRGLRHELQELKVLIHFRSTVTPSPVQRQLFGAAALTTSMLGDRSIEVIQAPGKELAVRIAPAHQPSRQRGRRQPLTSSVPHGFLGRGKPLGLFSLARNCKPFRNRRPPSATDFHERKSRPHFSGSGAALPRLPSEF